jgi:hypothetical protein
VARSRSYDQATRRAVSRLQREQDGLTAIGIVDPRPGTGCSRTSHCGHIHPGYLPAIRLHDLRHLAATLALTAGTEMKVVSAMLRHETLTITADMYTSVVPEVARAAAEASVAIVPRRTGPKAVSAAASTSLASGRNQASGRPSRRQKMQVRSSRAPGARTQNPRIKSPLLYH